MKRLLDILKTTALGGIGILLPLLLLCLLIREIFEFVVALADPITLLFPKGTLERLNSPELIAVLLILGVSFLFGLAARTTIGKRLGQSVNHRVMKRLPLYQFVKNLSAAIMPSQEQGFKPGLLKSADGSKEAVYVIEEQDNGDCTVLVPWVPMAFTGSLKIVPSERIELLDITLMEFSRILSQLGMGVEDLLEQNSSNENAIP